MLPITSLYVGVAALMYLIMTVLVGRRRMAHKVPIGDGDVPEVRQVTRAHGNTAEYLPILLLVIAGVEATGAPAWVVHIFGVSVILSRILHYAGLYSSTDLSNGRIVGMVMTLAILLIGGLGLIGHALMG